MGKRLWEVEVRFTYYAQTETATEAEEFASDAWSDGGPGQIGVQEVVRADHRLRGEWAPECLVYGAPDDVTLGDLLDQLPARGRS